MVKLQSRSGAHWPWQHSSSGDIDRQPREQELLHGIADNPLSNVGGGMAAALTVEQLIDTLAIRLYGLRAAEPTSSILWRFTDLDLVVRPALSRGALIQTVDPRSIEEIVLEVTLTKSQFLRILAGRGLDGMDHQGNTAAPDRLLTLLDEPDPSFPVVTP